MKKVFLSSLFLLATTPILLAGVDPAAQQLLNAAEQQADLFNQDVGPFRLEIDFVAQVQVPTQGHVTFRWEASNRWWRKVTMGLFQQIDVRNGEKLYTSRNAPFTPVRVQQLLNLLQVAENPDHLEAKKQKDRAEQGLAIRCVQVEEDKKVETHELCVNPISREILSDEWKTRPDGRSRLAYSDYLEFRGHRYPRKTELFENGIKAITEQVVSLSTAPLDDGLLVPPKGAIERRQCADMKHAVPVKTPDPLYPKSASQNRLVGDTTVSMTVFADGSVGEIQLIGSSAHSMDDATLQTLKGWKFKPAICGAEPVVSDIEVVVSFRLK